jgi:hypothetical protein
MTFAEKVNSFNRSLNFRRRLPGGIQIMNPFRENPSILPITEEFYDKFYNDKNKRYLILGINPGRHGAGVTGIPFTDTIRLEKYCGIEINGFKSYETSSEFIYSMIDAYGGVKRFYSRYYINAICPLGFTKTNALGKNVNYNYYDDKQLTDIVSGFMLESLRAQISFGIKTDVCYSLGTGKNYKYLLELNIREKLFGKIIPLEHPRFIMQYKRKNLQYYIDKYMRLLK